MKLVWKACIDDATSASTIIFRFLQKYSWTIEPIRLKFSGMILHSPSKLMWDFFLNKCSRLGELTKKLKIPRAFSFLVISSKLMDWLSWIYQIILLVLCKMNPENFSLIGSIVQEYFVKNEKLWQTRLWHHQYMPFRCV